MASGGGSPHSSRSSASPEAEEGKERGDIPSEAIAAGPRSKGPKGSYTTKSNGDRAGLAVKRIHESTAQLCYHKTR